MVCRRYQIGPSVILAVATDQLSRKGCVDHDQLPTQRPNNECTMVMQARGLVNATGGSLLDGADFELRAGEILAVSDNGAAKPA